MNQFSPSKDCPSKSIYSDVCQNESELNQILNRRQRPRKRTKQKTKNSDNAFVQLYSNDNINNKNFENSNDKHAYSSLNSRSFHENEDKFLNNNNENNNENNNMNINYNENNINNNNINDLNQNLNIGKEYNMKNFDISSINSNSNNKNFMEENTDIELNKIFGISNSDKNSQLSNVNNKKQKPRNSKDLKNFKNNSLYNYLQEDNSIQHLNNLKNLNNTENKFHSLNNNFYFFNSMNNTNNNIKNLSSLQKTNKNKNKSKNKKEKKINKKENIVITSQINNIKFEGFEKDELDKDYFDNKFTKLLVKSKNIKNEKNLNIKTLYELQNFEAENSAITSLKINSDGNFLALGFKSGKIKVYEIINYLYQKFRSNYCIKNLNEYLNFINETPYKILSGHPNEILDLYWLISYNTNKFLLSSSLELVILWNLSKRNDFITRKFYHRQIITCLSLNNTYNNIFGTGCKDNIIRLWSISKTLLGLPKQQQDKNNNINTPKQFYIKEDITIFNFFNDGNKVAVGTMKGSVLIYLIFPDIKFENKFECKNTFGKPIIDINFYNNLLCVISSMDSRIRLVNIKDGEIKQKYKGHQNEKNIIKTGLDLCNDIIIVGGENGYCYLYNIFNKENDSIKNYNYQYFKISSSNDVINLAQIVEEKHYVNYYKKILSITNKIILDSIIIVGNDKGEIKILLNIE